MKSLTGLRFVLLVVAATALVRSASAQPASVLPSALSLGDVSRFAGEWRDEIQAATLTIATVSTFQGFLIEKVTPTYAMWRRHQMRVSLVVSVPHEAVSTSEGAS